MKFKIVKCEYQTNKDKQGNVYTGPVVVLARGTGLSIYFPVINHTAKLLKYIFEVHHSNQVEELENGPAIHELTDEEKVSSAQTVCIYQTMVNLWRDNGLFLSGIMMDANYSIESDEDIIIVYMILSNEESGLISSVVKINFQHALALVALLKMEINISEMLLHKIIPEMFDDEKSEDEQAQNMPPIANNDKNFPVDNKLLDVAKALLKDVDGFKNPKNQRRGKKKE